MYRGIYKKIACAAMGLTVMMTSGIVQSPSFAAEADQTIRVAMYADLGSTYKSTIPAVTLKSGDSWTIGQDTGDSHRPWLFLSPGQTVKFSVDGYRVKVLETTNFATASAAAKALQATSDKPFIIQGSKNGRGVYQVYTGMYASEQAASSAATRTATTAAAQLGEQMPVVAGNKYLSAGSFVSEQEANLTRATINAAGYDAFTVLQSGDRYSVWIGEAASESQLSGVRAEVRDVVPGLTWSPANMSEPAILIRQDAGLGASAQTVRHYMLSGPESAKLTVQTSGESIQVVERSARSYRGDFEISKQSGQLALVNVLAVEQYLYSVVGAEVPASWPAESLKAQAVAARSYALFQNNKFKIADVVDTTLSQAYNGVASESSSVNLAVDATTGEVLKSGDKIIEAVFSSNAGGMTADPSEVWNGGGTLFASVESPGDASANSDGFMWYHVLLDNGKTGYVREDNARMLEGVTTAGLSQMTVTADKTNVRPIPQIQSGVAAVAQMVPGEAAVVLDKVPGSGAYSWVRGPYTSAEVLKFLNGKVSSSLPSAIQFLDVTKRGPSGRVLEVQANGQTLSVKYPDQFRSAFGGLPSTKFDISGTGSYTVLGAGGVKGNISGADGAAIMSASGSSRVASSNLVIMNGERQARVVDRNEGFLFTGQGNGHGLGLSQWGAKGMADEGYDYRDILQHYYQNVSIVKE